MRQLIKTLLYRAPLRAMEHCWTLAGRKIDSTLRAGSPVECRVQSAAALSRSWSCSCVSPELGAMLDMDRDYFGGSNESLAEKIFSGDEETSGESSMEDLLQDFVLADLPSSPSSEESGDEDVSLDAEVSETEDSLPPSPEEPPPLQPVEAETASREMSSSSSNDLPPVKPPNILVYTGSLSPGADFTRVKHRLQKCLDPDAYLIYFISPQQLQKDPWSENAALLVLYCEELSPEVRERALQFCQSGGALLDFFWGAGSSLLGDLQESGGPEWKFVEASSVHQALRPHMPRLVEACFPSGGRLLLFQQDLIDQETEYPTAQERRLEVLRLMLARKLGVQCSKRPQVAALTPGYLLHASPEDRTQFEKSLGQRRSLSGGGVELRLVNEAPTEMPSEESKVLPVIWRPGDCEVPEDSSFQPQLYFDHLQSRLLGRTLLYCPVTTSTMDLIQGLEEFPGAVVVASRQTQGKGRGGNSWLSPEGCAMFSLNLPVTLHSNLGHRLPFLQHLVSVAMVHSVRSLPPFHDADLRLKWPNDVYWGRRSKLGGLVVRTTLRGNTFRCHIGCGLNVANARPTVSLREALSADQGIELGVEEYIARTLTQLELLLDSYQRCGPSQLCLPLYYSYWLHSGQSVTLGDTGEEAMVEGIDDHGFLRVRTCNGGRALSLQPDGNSFDLLRNLISLKTTIP